MEKNQRSRMNCVVEKRRAEEIVDHQPRTIRLPFGVNVTTDPRYEHVSGEKMAIYCESGKDQRSVETELTLHIFFSYVTTFWNAGGSKNRLILNCMHLPRLLSKYLQHKSQWRGCF
jgi:hypothetical protein